MPQDINDILNNKKFITNPLNVLNLSNRNLNNTDYKKPEIYKKK